MGSIYICYFNTEEPLVHTQVLPYLRALAQDGIDMHLLTFEKRGAWRAGERARRRDLKRRLAEDGIQWHALKYHRRPSLLATGADALLGTLFSIWLILRHQLHIVHARAHVPGAMGLLLKMLLRRKLIFDLRGLMAEEYVDNGIWEEGSLPFRLVKAVERALLNRADHIIVLTEELRSILLGGAHLPATAVEKISVIPCCSDLSLYELQNGRRKPSGRDEITLVYLGSVGGRYMLGEMVEFFKVLQSKRSGARFLIITRGARADVERAFASRGVDANRYEVVAAEPAEVPKLLGRGDLALSFFKPTFAVKGTSPTKIGEYLAAGLPVVSTSTGDTAAMFAAEPIGAIVNEFDATAYDKAAEQVIHLIDNVDTRAHCRDAASRYFSLTGVGEPRYKAVYQSLSESNSCPKTRGIYPAN
jgi:glycosyltransferase involved in cell wall biosynthesis